MSILSDDTLEDEVNNRIISGYPANAGQFPYQVGLLILTRAGGNAVCGASIISPSWVLSAAHCTVPAVHVTMRFGSIQFQSGGVSQLTRRIENHPNFNPRNLNNDISLLHVPSALSFNNALNAVRLPRRAQQTETFDGRTSTVSGWGAIANNGPAQSLLRWTNVRIIANSECQRTFGSGSVVPHVVCSLGTTRNQGVCGGDSGGPLVVNEGGVYTQIGVVAFGAAPLLGGCTAGRPSGYMRTSHFLTWINQRTDITIRA